MIPYFVYLSIRLNNTFNQEGTKYLMVAKVYEEPLLFCRQFYRGKSNLLT